MPRGSAFGSIARGMMVDWEVIGRVGRCRVDGPTASSNFKVIGMFVRKEMRDLQRYNVECCHQVIDQIFRTEQTLAEKRDRPLGVLVCRENRGTMPDPRATSQFCALYSFTGILFMVRRMLN